MQKSWTEINHFELVHYSKRVNLLGLWTLNPLAFRADFSSITFYDKVDPLKELVTIELYHLDHSSRKILQLLETYKPMKINDSRVNDSPILSKLPEIHYRSSVLNYSSENLVKTEKKQEKLQYGRRK
jgi:hypothetical protein